MFLITLIIVPWHMSPGYNTLPLNISSPFSRSTQLTSTSNHTLIITNLGGKLILDFVNITGPSTVTSTATTMVPTSATSSAAVPGKPRSKPLPVEEIVGGILVGIFAAVATITVGVILLKRKENRRRQKDYEFQFARK